MTLRGGGNLVDLGGNDYIFSAVKTLEGYCI